MGLFRANNRCSYALRILGRFGAGPGGGPGGLFARLLTPALRGIGAGRAGCILGITKRGPGWSGILGKGFLFGTMNSSSLSHSL